MDEFSMWVLARLNAQRDLLTGILAEIFLGMEAPEAAALATKQGYAQRPTRPPAPGHDLDPAMTDLLASMTDEEIQDIMDRVVERIRERRS